MKTRAGLLTLTASLTLAAANLSASTAIPAPLEVKKAAEPGRQLGNALPSSPLAPDSSPAAHRFPVRDQKGLLLTCIAPEIDINANTDIFSNCTLAPGRTLDDVMHTFIGALHYEQQQRMQEQAERAKELEDKSTEKAAKK